jgi:DNA-binding NarL/FixJ family response regulator
MTGRGRLLRHGEEFDGADGFRAFARRMLEAAGFTVAEAATGAEATEAARTVRPGLVLLDIQLPDFDGFEVARRLAAAPGQDKAPVVVIVLALIVQHWRSARGWSRRAMVPVVWISFAIGLEQTLIWGPFNLPVSDLVSFGLAQLVLMTGPLLFVISTVRAWMARGALGTAIVDLEPGAPSGQLRDALARALGDSTLQVAFQQPDGSGYVDTAGQAVEVAQPDPGRAVVPIPGSHEVTGAVLVYDAGLELEPQLVRLTAAAASIALEHARLQAEVQAQLEQVRASRSRIVEAGDAERRRLERDLHDGAQQRLVTLSLALAMARDRAAADPELESLIESASKEAQEALTELRELARGIHPAVLTETGLVLALMAEGRSNHAIASQLYMSLKTVETHIGNLFAKLGLQPAAEDHRRVLAVLSYLRR